MIDVIAMVWLALSMCGLIFAAWARDDARNDREWLRKSGKNGPRLIVAYASVRNETSRFLVMLLFGITGVATLLRHALHSISTTLEYSLIYGGLVGGLAVLVVWTVLDRRDRQRLIRAIDEKER